MACSQSNFDGYAFSVYGGGGNCDALECISGTYDVGVDDNDKCTFGTAGISRMMTKFTFKTIDRSRYYIYVHFARTRADRPTADFRFFVDDEKNGEGSSSGAHMIQFEEGDKTDRASNDSGGKDGKSGDNESGGNESGESSSVIRSTGYYLYAVLIASWMIMIQ